MFTYYSEVAKDLGRKNMAKGISREKEHHLESVQCEKGSLRHIRTVVGLFSQSVVVLYKPYKPTQYSYRSSMLELLD